MVGFLLFDRHTGNDPLPEREEDLYPKINRNYYNPSFFSSRQAAVIEPGEQVLVVINTSDKLSKYYGFVDTIVKQTNKQMTIEVSNTHPTKNVEINKGLVLDSFLSHPFIISGFCSAIENDIGCVEVFHYWEAQQRKRKSCMARRYNHPSLLSATAQNITKSNNPRHPDIEEEEEEEAVAVLTDGVGGSLSDDYDKENTSPAWINSCVY